MAGKKTSADKGFLLRVDSATMAMVERWAADEFRSVNGQLQWIINDALTRHGRKKQVSANPDTEVQPDSGPNK